MEERRFGPVWFIPGLNRGKYPFCHSVYIEGAGVVIDPASDRERLEALRDDPGVRMAWLSHWHEDHITHLDLFDDMPLWVSEADEPPLTDIELFMGWYEMNSDEERQAWRKALKEQFNFRPRKAARFLKGGETIDLGTTEVEVISTPGHTPGHLSFFFKEPEVLFLGDYDLTRFGPWYGDLYSSIDETIASVERLRELPAKVWMTCHETGLFEEDPGELWGKYLDVIEKRDQKLMELLAEPRTMAEIIGAWIVYGKPREPKSFFQFGERAIMSKHAERLVEQGKAVMDGERYCLV